MATKTPTAKQPWERFFVRHVSEDRRTDLESIQGCINPPFPVSSSGSVAGGSEMYDRPRGRWLIGLRLKKQAWLSLFSNAGSGDDLVKALSKSRRLEVARVGYDAGKGWFFQLLRSGKPVVDFRLPAERGDDVNGATLVSAELDRGCLASAKSGDKALEKLCQHYQIGSAGYCLSTSDRQFHLLNAQGRSSKSAVNGYFIFFGHAMDAGADTAAADLAKALEKCDPAAIRAAVERGAPLDTLPGSSLSPLETCLFECRKRRWKESVAALVELGAPVNGQPGETPPLVGCVAHYIPEKQSLEMCKLLVSLGADVNAVDPQSGWTSLYSAVVDGRETLIRYLLAEKADPSRKDAQGQSVVDWLEKQRKERSGFSEQGKLAKLLSMVTGRTVEAPKPAVVEDKFVAENARLAAGCLEQKSLARLRDKAESHGDRGPAKRLLQDATHGVESRRASSQGVPAPTAASPGESASRYERLGYYCDFSRMDDPGYTTKTFAAHFLEELDYTGEEDYPLQQVVYAAGELLAMHHYQFLGAPEATRFLDAGVNATIKFFVAEANQRTRSLDYHALADLSRGILLCMVAGRWGDVGKLASWLSRARLERIKKMENDREGHATQIAVLVAARFRDKPLEGLKGLENHVKNHRLKPWKLSWAAWQAALEGNQEEFDSAVARAVQFFAENPKEDLCSARMLVRLDVASSIMVHAALRLGLRMPELPDQLADYLIMH